MHDDDVYHKNKQSVFYEITIKNMFNSCKNFKVNIHFQIVTQKSDVETKATLNLFSFYYVVLDVV